MNPRRFLFRLSLAACFAMLCAAGFQRRQLLSLRVEQRKLAEATVPTNDPPALPASSVTPATPIVRELLQLRNQVGQLRRRRDELLPVRAEHERLILQLASRGTNASALPPNYIRKAQARLVGYNTPQDTLQSFLWALQNHDVTNFLYALTPEQSRWFQSDAQRAGTFAKLFENSEAFVGFSIVNTQRFEDGTIEADLELAPGLPPIPVNLQQIENQWKISSLP